MTEPTELPHDATPGPAASTPPPAESGIAPRPIELLSDSSDDRPTCPCAHNEAYHDNDDDEHVRRVDLPGGGWTWEQTGHDVPGTAQTEAESTQGSAEELGRTIRLSWLREAADILLNTWLGYEEEISGVARQMHEADNKYFDTIVYRQIKALMLAGWCAPQERTLAVPNGLVLREEQWRSLAEGNDVHVMLPGGRHALVLEATASHGQPHFTVGSELHDELWAERARAAIEASGQAWGRGYGKTQPNTQAGCCVTCHRQLNTEDPRSIDCGGDCRQCMADAGDEQEAALLAQSRDWKVPVPRSFLTNLVAFAYALREAGDFAAANALDNFLSVIQAELTQFGIGHVDHGRNSLPEMNAQARTKQSTPPLITANDVIQLGKELIGKTFTVKVPRDTTSTGVGGRHVPHPATDVEDLRYQLGQLTDESEKVRRELLPILAVHPETKDAVAATQPDTLRAGYVAKVAATLLASYANELERMRREGTPGVIHEVDRDFYDLAVKERDLERAKVDRLEAELRSARDHITRLQTDVEESRRAERQLKGALETTQRGLVRMETQRDDLRTAIAMAAGVDPDQISEIDTDYEDLLKDALAQREASRLVQDAIAEDES